MRAVLLLLLLAVAPCFGETGSVDLKGSLGWTGFLDESSQDHLLLSGSARYYFTRRLSVEPEVQYLRLSDTHHDWVFLPSVNYDFRSGRVVPYVSAGFGVIRVAESGFGRSFSTTEGFLSGGFGAKIYATERVFIAPEFRIGLEPHARFSVGLGYSWRR